MNGWQIPSSGRCRPALLVFRALGPNGGAGFLVHRSVIRDWVARSTETSEQCDRRYRAGHWCTPASSSTTTTAEFGPAVGTKPAPTSTCDRMAMFREHRCNVMTQLRRSAVAVPRAAADAVPRWVDCVRIKFVPSLRTLGSGQGSCARHGDLDRHAPRTAARRSRLQAISMNVRRPVLSCDMSTVVAFLR